MQRLIISLRLFAEFGPIAALLRYVTNVLIAVDQLGTSIIGGYPDETLSSYAYRLRVQRKFFGFMADVIDRLFFWQKNHCWEAYISERERHQLPPTFRH